MSEFTDKFKKERGKEFTSIMGYSATLCRDFSEYFEEWWHPKTFNWFFKKYLIDYCSSDVLTWFDPEKVDYTDLDPCSIVLLKKHGKL